MPRNIVGSPVAGDDFFGRDPFVAEIEARAETGSILLLAPRRWGKTSVLRAMRDRDSARRHYFDLYHLDRAPGFIAEVAASSAGPVAAVRRRVGEVIGRELGRIEEVNLSELAIRLRERITATSWQDTARALLRSFPKGHMLMFDEFPVMAKSILDRDRAEGAELLRVLRHERQRDGGPKMIFAGSTSLPELCRQAGLSDTINDLEILPVPRLDRSTAEALLSGVFATEGIAVSPASLDAALDLVGPEVPFFLQVMARALIAEVRDTGARVTPSLVRRLYHDVLLSADYRAYLDDFRGRLDRAYLPEEREIAISVLDTLSREPDGLSTVLLRSALAARGLDDRLMDRVLALLQGDFYVARDEGGAYRFLNRYLADWWRRFHA